MLSRECGLWSLKGIHQLPVGWLIFAGHSISSLHRGFLPLARESRFLVSVRLRPSRLHSALTVQLASQLEMRTKSHLEACLVHFVRQGEKKLLYNMAVVVKNRVNPKWLALVNGTKEPNCHMEHKQLAEWLNGGSWLLLLVFQLALLLVFLKLGAVG